ncbi:unnamed protein product [Phytophthora fragariaefolia]|uniref:Unnamed protein product n=1 Tax=Phytophthora fragariaefolia TaxID=1490495 RepID=A0A9W6XBL0_9STRA|nr:unnamed protein product [Phytophthora fragariaefolia]
MRELHFVDNTADQGRDKLWKLRPVVDKIQKRFLEGWSLLVVFLFDEGVLPATSRRNTTRMSMSDKPHRYGSKLFMLCGAKTSTATVYVGKRRSTDDSGNEVDFKTGAAALVRNLKVPLTAERRHPWHAVVIDRYYSSVLHAVELLSINTYVVGTIATSRLGFDQNIKSTKQTRPASVLRGSFSFSRSVDIPINAYLSHKEGAKINQAVPMRRSEWFAVLQNQLLQLKAEYFAGVEATPTPSGLRRKRAPARLTHAVQLSEDWFTVSNVQKRRQRSCKVCALLRTKKKKKSYSTTYYCERCSVDSAKCWLCNRIRREHKGVAKTCFEIWHDDFDAGQAIPPHLVKRVVLR